MKFYIAIVSLFFSSICIAQYNTTVVKPCEYKYPTSITQIADAKPSDVYYTALENLIERFGVIALDNNDTKFYQNEIFTNAKWVVILNSCLGRMNELVESTFEEKRDANGKLLPSEENADSGTASYKKMIIRSQTMFETYNHKLEKINEIKDIKETDCFYEAAYMLIERWHLDFTNEDGLMHPTDPVNVGDVERIIQHVFFYQDFKISQYTKGKMTKAEAAIMMSDVLDRYITVLDEYSKEGEVKETANTKSTKDNFSIDDLFIEEQKKEKVTSKEVKDTTDYADYFKEYLTETQKLLDNITLKKSSNKILVSEKDIPNMQQSIIKLTELFTAGFEKLKLNEHSKVTDRIVYYSKANPSLFANTEYIFEKNNNTSYAAYYNDEENKRISLKAFLAVPKGIKNALAYVKLNDGLSNEDYIRHDLIVAGKIVASYLEYKKDNYNSIQVYQNGYY
jgi:hypothetical protein